MADLQTLDSKLDLALQLLGEIKATPPTTIALPAPVALQPYEVPELPLSAIDPATIDHKTVQADGSTWMMQPARGGQPGGPEQVIYGYISKAKAPALWDRMVAALGGDEAWLQSMIDRNGKLARYTIHPEWAVQGVGAERFQRLSQILSNPTPETPPTIIAPRAPVALLATSAQEAPQAPDASRR